jgi:hypothetical protein
MVVNLSIFLSSQSSAPIEPVRAIPELLNEEKRMLHSSVVI